MSDERELQELRREISRVTKEIIQLIALRNEVAKKIGQIKARDSLPIEDESVEEGLYRDVLEACERLDVDREIGSKILNLLLAESKRIQGSPKRSELTPMNMFAKATELESKGRRLIRLDVGEPDFHPPKAVIEASSAALFNFKTHYTQTRGISELVSALRLYLHRKHNYEAKEDEVIITPGGRFSVYASLESLLKEGERCIVIDPSWPAYKEVIEHIGTRASIIDTRLEDSWEPSIEKIKEVIGPTTKALILNYPSNPTGKMIGTRLFKEIIGVANDHGITVISDETYADYSYSQFTSILGSGAKRFVLIGSLSKTWAMTGFRIGYAVSSHEVISMIMRLQSLMITSVPEFVQVGAIKAFESNKEIEKNAKVIKERIEAASSELDRIDGIEYYKPDGSMYIFPRVKSFEFDSSSFAMKLLDEKGVSVSPGTGFGAYREYFRISLGQSNETIVEGIKKIGEMLS
jgi:aspartate aminotransferase